MTKPDVTADDVLGALVEFDELGRREFLAKYGFGEARQYFLRHNDTDYDSKAVVGAAHTRRHGVPLTAADFSGGEATVKRLLEGLGFAVQVRPKGLTTSTALTEESLGAWVLKCNPAVWDLAGYRSAGGTVIDDWTVVENFRSDMMRYGQRVLLWVTGSLDGPIPRGFWGSGWVTGEVSDVVDADEDLTDGAADVDYWLDHDARDRMRRVVPVDLRLWDRPIPETDVLTVDGLDQLEIIRARQMSNPSWISADQLALLEPLLPAWPVIGAPAMQVVTLGPSGAGPGDPLTRAVVEAAAIRAVDDRYRTAGYNVVSVERDKCGWDLTCTAPDGTIARVEVKGVSGSRPNVLLTRNEYRSAVDDVGWVLAVVTNAVRAPVVRIYQPDEVRAAAEPYVYRADLAFD